MKKYTRLIFALATAVLTFIATTGAANACALFYFQPEVPEALQEK